MHDESNIEDLNFFSIFVAAIVHCFYSMDCVSGTLTFYPCIGIQRNISLYNQVKE